MCPRRCPRQQRSSPAESPFVASSDIHFSSTYSTHSIPTSARTPHATTHRPASVRLVCVPLVSDLACSATRTQDERQQQSTEERERERVRRERRQCE
jgi:hypothetical protein